MNDADAVFWKNCGIENRDIKLITLKKNSFRTKSSYCKAFHRVSIVNRNEKNLDTYE